MAIFTTWVLTPYTICSKGQILTPEQAKLLKLLQYPSAKFHIKVKAHWKKDTEQRQLFHLLQDRRTERNNGK